MGEWKSVEGRALLKRGWRAGIENSHIEVGEEGRFGRKVEERRKSRLGKELTGRSLTNRPLIRTPPLSPFAMSFCSQPQCNSRTSYAPSCCPESLFPFLSSIVLSLLSLVPPPHTRSGELSCGDVSHWDDPELQSRDLTQPGGGKGRWTMTIDAPPLLSRLRRYKRSARRTRSRRSTRRVYLLVHSVCVLFFRPLSFLPSSHSLTFFPQQNSKRLR